MTAFIARSTNMPNGVTNADQAQSTMGASGVPDPSFAHQYHNDFDVYAAGDWTTTVVGTGTTALAAGDGGLLLMTNTTGATDSISAQLKVAGFAITPGKALFFKYRGKLSDITNTKFVAGLVATSTTPLTANDGLFLYKASGASTFVLRSAVGGVNTDLALPAACVPVAATMFEIGFMVDAAGNVAVFWNPKTGTAEVNPAAVARGRVAAAYAQTLTAVNLAPTIMHTNINGVANTLTTDYITVVNER